MSRYRVLFLLVDFVTAIATLGYASAESSLDLHGGRPMAIEPKSSLGARRDDGHHPFHDFRQHIIIGVPLFFFDPEPINTEPEIEVVPPSPPLSPTQQRCPPGPSEPTFTTEMTNGVQITRGHSDRC